MRNGRTIRVGLPWRTRAEEIAGKRERFDYYLAAIRAAGGEPVEVSLGGSREETEELAKLLDAVVLTGSPADVDPSWYHTVRHPRTADADPYREQTDFALLDVAFRERKPVLAICYGVQSLNVYLGGTLFQHIPEEIDGALEHEKDGQRDRFHDIVLEENSRLARLAGATSAHVNTSHHQSVLRPGSGLRIVARAPDGVVEAVELVAGPETSAAGQNHWVTGVQWHPERMPDDALTRALFGELIAAAKMKRA
jgi:putative glutamine amidotransferase